MTNLTKRDIGKIILVEGQFPIKIKHLRKRNIPSKMHLDDSFYPGDVAHQFSNDGSGWYQFSKTDIRL